MYCTNKGHFCNLMTFSVSDLLSTGTYNRPAKIPFIKSIIAISESLLLFIVQSFYSIVLKNIVKQEWKSSKNSLAVQYIIKQPFCVGFLLVVAPSNFHRGKH